MVRIRTLTLALVLIVLLVPEGAAAAPATRIIVKREPGVTAAERADFRADAGVRHVDTLSLPRTEVVSAPAGEAADALRALNADPDVAYAEPDRVRTIATSDPLFNSLWGLERIDVADAWLMQTPDEVGITGDAQVVAVVDSGIDKTHPDLVHQIDSVRNFVGADASDTSDGSGHGTHVSGTIAAEGDNHKGIVGVAPDARIMALRVLDDTGVGLDSDIAEAFLWAGTHHVRIVNASLGAPGASQTLRSAIADSPDTLFILAAANGGPGEIGDDNDDAPIYPCNTPEPNIVCVGASTEDTDDVASFSNYGARSVDLFAPGESIVSTWPVALGSSYARADGTSMAAPHVSGVAALILQASPLLTPHQVKQTLLGSTDPSPAFDDKSVSGGRLDAAAAVELALDGTVLPDDDNDGWANRSDACPTVTVLDSPDGCPLDDDWDHVVNASDNCVLQPNPTQGNLDRDPLGDACDPDIDGDGVSNDADACDAAKGPASNSGCPVPPPPPPPPPSDSDGDGHPNGSDPCPYERAGTSNGCPVPAFTALSTKVRRCGRGRCATVRVLTNRLATVRVTIERRTCKRHHCRWVRVTRTTTTTTFNAARVKSRPLKPGAYRAVVVLSSAAGRARPETDGFRVR